MRSPLPRIAPAAAACALALAACGSEARSAGTTARAGTSEGLMFSQCMRAHGVPTFPDPDAAGGYARGSSAGAHSPAFQAAQAECIHILKAGGPRHAPSAAERAALVTFARCMRDHRVPRFPDPVSSLPSRNVAVLVQGGMMFPLGATIDPDSPAFRQASATCAPGGPRGPAKGG